MESGEESPLPLEKILNPLIKNSTGISPSVDVKFPWKSPFRKEEAGLQVPEGDVQMYNIGKRYAKKFPEILAGKISISDFNFTSSCSSRCSQSTTALGVGYLEGKGNLTKLRIQPIPITTPPCSTDRLHRQSVACPKWMKDILFNKATWAESDKFLKSSKFQNIVHKIQQKLGLKNVNMVDENLVLSMFRACAWSVEAFGDSADSGWCSLFDSEDQKAYDLYVDLYSYYLFGPGNELNADTGCPLMKDIIANIQSAAGMTTGIKKSKFIVRVGHSSTVLAPLFKLGLFVDKIQLKANDYKQLKNRKFRFGEIAPMSGNFAFVLYKCNDKKYRIQLYLNERLIELPACQSQLNCTLTQFLGYYQKIISKCDYDKACKVVKTARGCVGHHYNRHPRTMLMGFVFCSLLFFYVSL